MAGDGGRTSQQASITVERNPQMETIQAVLDAELLGAADRMVRRIKSNRSAPMREALARMYAGWDVAERTARATSVPTGLRLQTSEGRPSVSPLER